MEVEEFYELPISWKGTKFTASVCSTDTVGDLKAIIFSLTNVPIERQKILGLVKGALPSDEVALSSSLEAFRNSSKTLTLIGTPEGQELRKIQDEAPDVSNDLDVDYKGPDGNLTTRTVEQNERRNKRKLHEAVEKLSINIMAEPRPGKKLLVLDLDYTIMDVKMWNDPSAVALDFARPYLKEFLEYVYPYYDIVIWSQTSWRYLEGKLVELGMIGGGEMKCHICFVLDRTPMFSVYSTRHNKPFKHEVKALDIIWKKFPEHFSPDRTIHVDDLGRNFAMNPKQGLKISAFKNARQNVDDRELLYLAKYLLLISGNESFNGLDHNLWRVQQGMLPEGIEDPVLKHAR
ncbi:ubiquitin family proteint [Atractiella rhizophila]|nr:ubiquitin family proteint [Atractiella rhizophila]